MPAYRVLLVDDEEEIRSGIGSRIDWRGLGFELVGEAENGEEALELADSLRPDLVMTDIKMPYMDGLTLCSHLVRRLPAAKLVVFSGFDDFKYAKQAIRFKVSEYILKPINASELTAVLQKLKAQLDAEREERSNLEALRRRYQESLPLLREQFYTRLLDGRVDPQRLRELSERYDVGLDGDSWVAALAHFDSVGGEAAIGQSELLPLSVQQLIDENLDQPGCCFKTCLYNDTVAVIASFSGGAGVLGFLDALGRVCKLARSYFGMILTFGVGSPCKSPLELQASASGARSALDYRVLLGVGRAIYIDDLEPDHSACLVFDDTDERELAGAIKLGGEEEIRAVIDRLMGRVQASRLPLPECQCFFLELVSCLIRLTRANALGLSEVFGPDFTGAVLLTDFNSPGELGRWCADRCLKIRELIRRERSDSTRRTVERACGYIGENFADGDLSVERLCEHLHLSPAYFSTIFKRETGMSFTNYVTRTRMEEAARLLRDTDDKTYLIAEKTGFVDANYFSYVFKKHFGLSPSRYRAGPG